VVNDGSTDETARIVKEYDVRLISTENLGLSNARNLGWQAATGSIVAYLDDDAYPDPDWLSYLAISFASSTHVGIGGPNIDPAGDGFIADCVANSPGGPVHVLLTDEVAEHIPGCNMAFRKEALQAVGGFDTLFRVAGDDVDICWKLQARGWTLGYSPAALVWHHSRNSIRTYCKQQRGYGRAEALLESKWPEKFNSAGHHTFSGRIYGKGFEHMLGVRPRVYHGVWGSAPFQGLYHQSPGTFLSLPMMPEWYMVIAFMAFLAILSLSWPPLLVTLPVLVLAVVPTLVQAVRGGLGANFHIPYDSRLLRGALRIMTAFLHLMQPLARLIGRVQHGLTFWRGRGTARFTFPQSRETALWTEDWAEPAQRVAKILTHLQSNRAIALCGDEFARWDIEVRGGMFGAARMLMAVEDHGAGAQYVRTRVWCRCRRPARVVCVTSAVLAACALVSGGWLAAGTFLSLLLLVGLWTVKQCGSAMSHLLDAVPHSSAS
jgi:O-antigen biosynthesis protein